MRTQTALGWLFVLLGILLVAVDLAPTIDAIRQHAPPVLPSFMLLGIALGVLVFGGWLLPSAHVGSVVREYLAALRPTSVPFLGRGDRGAPPSDPPASTPPGAGP
jgi:hypothetical protein